MESIQNPAAWHASVLARPANIFLNRTIINGHIVAQNSEVGSLRRIATS